MTREVQGKVLKMAEEAGIDARAYEGLYSGRGMYGRTTHAIVVGSAGDVQELSVLWGERLAREGAGVPQFLFRWDNLGLSFVVY